MVGNNGEFEKNSGVYGYPNRNLLIFKKEQVNEM